MHTYPFRGFFLACTLGVLVSTAAPASLFERTDPSANGQDAFLAVLPPLKFSVDSRMRQNVEFWIKIYTQYSTTQGLIHDAKYIDHVYEIMDLHQPGKSPERLIKDAKKKWKDVLLSVSRKQNSPQTMTADEKRVFELFADIHEPDKFVAAAHRKRMRFQLGQREQFLSGLRQSGRYLPQMEEVFKQAGMPVELTRLPFVESSFNVHARSKVGASGIWQFMRSTARHFVKINDAIDERNDPIRSAEAAAQLLKLNYESLGSWPLAVTAYNHGRKGMMRAVRRVGSEELEDLVSSYRSRTFGFASSNFFTEFLAAVEVEKNAERYFGKVDRDAPLKYAEAKIPDYIDIRELAKFLKLDIEVIRDLNPALTDAVYQGYRLVPSGYTLRLPHDGGLEKDATVRVFLAGYNQIPGIYKLRTQLSSRYGKKKR